MIFTVSFMPSYEISYSHLVLYPQKKENVRYRRHDLSHRQQQDYWIPGTMIFAINSTPLSSISPSQLVSHLQKKEMLYPWLCVNIDSTGLLNLDIMIPS